MIALRPRIRRCSICESLVLIGKLNFVCRAVTPGRAFLRRLIDLTRGAGHPHHKVRITCGAREDLRAWLALLRRFNGKVMRSAVHWTDNSALRFYTDASGIALALVSISPANGRRAGGRFTCWRRNTPLHFWNFFLS